MCSVADFNPSFTDFFPEIISEQAWSIGPQTSDISGMLGIGTALLAWTATAFAVSSFVITGSAITALTGGISKAIWMAIVVIVLQQIDANIINPRIIGSSLNISPILIIFSVTVAGAYFGIIGMFLAVPVVTVIKLLLEDYIELKNR